MGVRETGRVGYLEAFGGDEFGYAYTYAISGAPESLSVERDTGMLTLNSGLAAGSYPFTATVTNRRDTFKVATFPVTLTISPLIQLKTYVVDSGNYGTPVGNDYSQVLLNLNSAIVADQAEAGDEMLHATIVFHAGKLYTYANETNSDGSNYGDNRWTYGIQYLTIKSDQPGVQAQLQNTFAGDGASISMVPLVLGRQYFECDTITKFNTCDDNKAGPSFPGYFIKTNTAGTNQVTLQNAGDASNLVVGRWVMIGSYDQQNGGFPPNIRYHEYARIASMNGATVTLDRNLRFTHQDNYYEGSDANSLGLARIYAIDRDDVRTTLRATVRDIDFLPNPAAPTASVISTTLDTSWENCSMPTLTPSESRFVRVFGGTYPGGIDFDKLMSMVILENLTLPGGIFEGTGADYMLVRNSTVTTPGYGIAPRQYRAINSTLIGGTSQNPYYPFLIISWGTQSIDIRNSSLNSSAQPIGEWPGAAMLIGIGKDATWNGNTLTVPEVPGYTNNQSQWLASAFVGQLVYGDTSNAPKTTSSWGYITQIYGDSSNEYADITWVSGTPPAAGEFLYLPPLYAITVNNTSRLTGSDTTWSSVSSDEGTHVFPPPAGTLPFPAGYPSSQYPY